MFIPFDKKNAISFFHVEKKMDQEPHLNKSSIYMFIFIIKKKKTTNITIEAFSIFIALGRSFLLRFSQTKLRPHLYFLVYFIIQTPVIDIENYFQLLKIISLIFIYPKPPETENIF